MDFPRVRTRERETDARMTKTPSGRDRASMGESALAYPTRPFRTRVRMSARASDAGKASGEEEASSCGFLASEKE